jgi:DNA-binding NarL/FixJ family response regulator
MKILLIDDHMLFREGLIRLIHELSPGARTVGVDDVASALVAVSDHPDLDLVLIDLGLPGMSGVASLIEFRQANDHLPVVVLSGQADPATVLASLHHGAMGFIPKTVSMHALHEALQTVLAGGICLPPVVLGPGHDASGQAQPLSAHCAGLDLTVRQREVFKLILRGRPNKLIARDLGVSESTVKAHVKPILKALKVTSRVEAILAVAWQGILID